MPELLIILAIAVLLFGSTKLPQLGRSLGGAIRGFKKSVSGEDESADESAQSKPAAKTDKPA
jgi:sec-independent protein translocase protein TatA